MKTTTDWLNLAASQDKSRRNLSSIYRDETALVATDGHRLHLISGLPKQTPVFIDGTDEVFPDYKQIFPKNNPTNSIDITMVPIGSSLRDLKQHIAELEKLAAILKPLDNLHGVKLTLQDDQLTLSANIQHLSFSLKLNKLDTIYSIEDDQPNITIGFNLRYFIDVLKIGLIQSTIFKMNIYGHLAPIIFNGGNITAVVMPMRLNT